MRKTGSLLRIDCGQKNIPKYTEEGSRYELSDFYRCHWFTVDTFEHLLHGGRVSSVAATMGTVLNIKPMLYVDEEGKLKTAEKPRGNKQAIKAKLAHMQESWTPEIGNLVVVGHADNIDAGIMLRDEVISKFPEADVKLVDIGPIIGAHVGPGMTALIFWGKKR